MLPISDIRLFVVVPVYGNWGDTLDCLKALDAQHCRSFHVLIADDESPEPAPAEIHNFAFAEYLRGPHLGFAGTCNRAARTALDQGATHLLFLNNDTLFAPGFIATWLESIAAQPEAIMSPVIFWWSSPSKIWISGGKKTVFLPYLRPRHDFVRPTKVDIVCGCTLLVQSVAWRQLRGFDERFVTYYEDYDFVLRAREAGYAAAVVPDVNLRVWHRVSGSFRGKHVWQQHYRLLASRLLFIRTHYRGVPKVICLAMAGGHLLAQLILNLPQLPNLKMLRSAVAEGMRHS